MTNANIDNSVGAGASILWQYEHAPNLLSLIGDGTGCFSRLMDVGVTDFWDAYRDSIINADRDEDTPWDEGKSGEDWLIATKDVGLDFLGELMGVPRPQVGWGNDDVRPLTNRLFRQLIRAKAYVYGCRGTIPELNEYLNILFGGDNENPRSRVVENFSDDDGTLKSIGVMAAEATYPYFAEESDEATEAGLFYKQHYDIVMEFPAGVLTNLLGPDYDGIIGLNDDQGSGQQDLRNYAPHPALAEDNGVNGGVFSEEDTGIRQGLYESLDVIGHVTAAAGDTASATVSVQAPTNTPAYIMWGDGTYNEVTSSGNISHSYTAYSVSSAYCIRASNGLNAAIQ